MALPFGATTQEEEPKFKFLRPYQWDAVYHVTAQIADGQRELGIQAPTGSGKSLMMTTILAKVMGRFFRGAIVAAPAVQIEDGFFRSLIIEGESGKMAGSASRIHYEINRDEFFLRPRKNNLEANLQMLKDHVRAKSPEVPVLLTTHQQVTRWATDTLPDDLTGQLFIADEAQRAGIVTPTRLSSPSSSKRGRSAGEQSSMSRQLRSGRMDGAYSLRE